MSDHRQPAPTQLVARTPEDVLAMVPVTLGFHPEESLVLLTVGAGQGFHARVDLPGSHRDLPEVVEMLLEPVRQHRVARVLLVGYSARTGLVRRAVAGLVRALRRDGVRVVDALVVTRGRWHPGLPGIPAGPGHPFDPSVHPFVLEAIVQGRILHRSRAELRSTLAPDPRRVAAVAGRLPPDAGGGEGQRAAETAWLIEAVTTGLGEASLRSPERVARLLAALADGEAADEVWFTLTRANAAAHVELWTSVLPAAPPGWVAAPAALLACAAWLTGDGALAWCALDRCLAEDPAHQLGLALAHALESAVPPSVWDERPLRSRTDPA